MHRKSVPTAQRFSAATVARWFVQTAGFISVAQIFPNTALVLQSASSRIAIAEEGGRGLTIWLCTQFSTFV